MAFNIVAVLALANDCAKSCYLGWHNGRPSFGVILVAIPAILVWAGALSDTYIFVVIIILLVYVAISFGDVIFREKHPKGDPFKTNQYSGVMDMDGFEFDESTYVPISNTLVEDYDLDEEEGTVTIYGDPKSYGAIQKHLEEQGFEDVGGEFTYIPNDLKDVSDEERETINKMVDRLEEFDDVQTVYTNMKPKDE